MKTLFLRKNQMSERKKLDYFYSNLTAEEKRIYTEIVKGLLKLNRSVRIRNVSQTTDFHRILIAVKEDYPEFFFVNFSAVSIAFTGFITTVCFTFYYNDIEICWLMEEITSIISRLSFTGNALQDEFNIHKFIVNNISYGKTNRIPNEAFTIKGALVDKTAVCEGYSKTFKLLCNHANIPCITISGTALNEFGMNENHSWNIVKINDDYFHVDSTWNRNTLESLSLSLYLNVSDKFISGNHFWQRDKYPVCVSESRLEAQIKNVKEKKMLETILNNAVNNKQSHILLSCNFPIDSSEELMYMVNYYLTTGRTVKSYQVSYIKELNCGIIQLKY